MITAEPLGNEFQLTEGHGPEILVLEFEKKYIFKKHTDPQGTGVRQRQVIWRSVRRLLTHLQIEPWHLWSHSDRVYDWFSSKALSVSYMRKTLITLNLWGRFYSRRFNRVYEIVKCPSGHELRAVYDAYYAANGGTTRESGPITPETLETNQGNFSVPAYHWLYLSVWLGLRPREVDSLKLPTLYRFESDKRKTPLLKVYQSKLINIPPAKRWKTIPLVLFEQKRAIDIILSRNFRRPLTRKVSQHLGARVKLNGGRKGFVDLMLSKGQDIFDISQWLGHWTVKRTWFDYKNRQEVHYYIPEKDVRV